VWLRADGGAHFQGGRHGREEEGNEEGRDHDPRNAGGDEAGGPTLHDAAEGYLAFLDKDGAGDGTLSSYRMELKTAMSQLGSETPLATITTEMVATYFASDVVTKTRHGKPKAKATVDKTRRVLRLALMWAQDEKLVDVAPVPAPPVKAVPADVA
jgi:hypothetical protein